MKVTFKEFIKKKKLDFYFFTINLLINSLI